MCTVFTCDQFTLDNFLQSLLVTRVQSVLATCLQFSVTYLQCILATCLQFSLVTYLLYWPLIHSLYWSPVHSFHESLVHNRIHGILSLFTFFFAFNLSRNSHKCALLVEACAHHQTRIIFNIVKARSMPHGHSSFAYRGMSTRNLLPFKLKRKEPWLLINVHLTHLSISKNNNVLFMTLFFRDVYL